MSMSNSVFGFIAWRHNGNLYFQDLGNFQTRNQSTQHLFQLANAQLKDFDKIFIYTGDTIKQHPQLLSFSYSNRNPRGDTIIPDFSVCHWREAGISDYNDIVNELLELHPCPPPIVNKIGWIGNVHTSSKRQTLLQLSNRYPQLIEAYHMDWNHKNNYMTLLEQIHRWRYLIDVEGIGFSARLKFFFFSGRVVFIQDREHKDIVFKYIKPYIHYIPVRNDLSDLLEKLHFIMRFPQLEQQIIHNALTLAKTHLTREAYLNELSHMINEHAPSLPNS